MTDFKHIIYRKFSKNMKNFIQFLNGIHRYGIVYILTFFPIKLYFSQFGKEDSNRIYQKVSLRPIPNSYFYGYAKDNEFWQ